MNVRTPWGTTTGRWLTCCLAVAACGRGTAAPPEPPSVVPATAPAGSSASAARRPLEPAEAAFLSGWMPLAPTGIPTFQEQFPTYDGRGVLIAILDSGIDPGVAGLQLTSAGLRKVLDLRDFSAEGHVPLIPVIPTGDRVTIGSRTLTGFGRVLSYSVSQQYYAGTIAEVHLGTPLVLDPDAPPGSDLNGNGRYRDTLAVVVARTQSGWALFTDTDGDGSLGNERPIHDFLMGRETFAWSSGGQAPLTLAANFSVQEGQPRLDLFFDTSSHGTHVAGIAAGNDLYGIDGFDGVAPGAQIIALKISNNARGGISMSGSIAGAMQYAIDFAEQRRLPLVINLSFGVGNEGEGKARIDAIVDSILAVHPEVVMTVSAGNDGPGLSTLGFPGSAGRPVSVGATFPLVFLRRPIDERDLRDPIAFFSARGGELAKPDLVAPGVAYSTVPPWNTGQERNAGTSMAAPHVAGLAARLLSATISNGEPVIAATLKRSLMVTATPIDGAGYVDQGTGIPNLPAALRWLRERSGGSDTLDVATLARMTILQPGATIPPTEVMVPIGHTGPLKVETFSEWLDVTDVHTGPDRVRFLVRHEAVPPPGRARSGLVMGWGADPVGGPLFRVLETVVRPTGAGQDIELGPATLRPGEIDRVFFTAEAGRPLELRVATAGVFERMFTSLHEPGGMPYRGMNGLQAGPEPDGAVYRVDGSDVISGVYQLTTAASPVAGGQAHVRVRHSPFLVSARNDGSDLLVSVANRTAIPRQTTVRAALIGGVYQVTIQGGGPGDRERRLAFTLPDWAGVLEVDAAMDRRAWSRFTDFGFTVLDTLGRIVADAPLNYASGRMHLDLEDDHRGLPVVVALLPGLADAHDEEAWSITLSIRLYAKRAVALEPSIPDASGGAEVPPDRSRTIRFRRTTEPWPLEEGFVPLGRVEAQTEESTWTTRVVLSPAAETP